MKVGNRFILLVLLAALSHPLSAGEPGTTFRDCDDCPTMIVVPAGDHSMGTPYSVTQAEGVKPKRAARERPVHSVTFSHPFAIGKFEVTRRQYATFVEATDHEGKGGCKYWTGDRFEVAGSKGWRDPGYPQADDHPAVCLSWDDARAYVGWLAAKTGKPYRLPSEAEWEYAARATSGTARFWGNAPAAACRFANVFDESGARDGAFPTMTPHPCDDGFIHTSPVGAFLPNAFGLHDTAGNAWEWTEDCWHKTYAGAPADGRAWTADGRCTQRVVRGGSWISIARYVRSGNRSKINTGSRIYRNGLRVALSLPR